MSNLATVQAIYAAFGRGDVPFILSQLAPDVAWDARDHHGIPLLVPRRGPSEVAAFFGVMRNVELEHFALHKLHDGGDSVVAWISIAFTWKPTGRRFQDDMGLHFWQFDTQGLVTRMFHVEDTHAMWRATVA